ncbi:SAM-dependent methyltransferase [Flexivirga sp. B27]
MTWQSWRTAWHDALYGPDGFYRQADGPAGHFATSAQGIPGGGRLLARAVAILAENAGCQRLIDVGAGRGELLTEVSAVAPTLQLTGVDVVERPADLPEPIDWLTSPGGADLPDALAGVRDTLVVAHEWLDVVPCTVAEYDGAVWRTVEVDPTGVERLGGPVAGAELQWLQSNWPSDGLIGARAEIGESRDAAYRALRSRIDNGLLVVVDYGHLRDSRPRRGTLTGYRHGAQCSPVPDGSTDITAHVAMDTLDARESRELVRQSTLFDRLGLHTGPPPIELASQDPPAYLQALADRGSYAQLTAPGGLGDFWWSIGPVGR